MKSPKNPNTKTSKAEKKQNSEEYKAKLDTLLNEINHTYAIVQRGSHVHVMREGVDAKGHREITYLSPRDFMLKVAHHKIWSEAEDKFISIGHLWTTWEQRREYDGIYFHPSNTSIPRYYNLWRGFSHTPHTNGKCDIFLDHVRTNICAGNESYYQWVMAWLADIFQKPDNKPGTALVLRGEMGIGKGAFANHIGHLLGQHYLTVANASQVTGRFNSHMAEKIMMFVDESFWSGEKVGAGVLRALITEPQQSSEMKGRDIIMIDSFLRLIIAANDDWVVPVGMKDERRFTVLDVGNASQRNYDYFNAMKEELENGGYGTLLHTLLHWEYDPILPKTIIQTEALLDQKLHSMKDELKWWMDCLSEGKLTDSDMWPNEDYGIEIRVFYAAYSSWCDTMKAKKKLSAIALPRNLAKFVELNRKRNVYQIKPVIECRKDFEDGIGHTIKWGDE
jgi:hypothetical protein